MSLNRWYYTEEKLPEENVNVVVLNGNIEQILHRRGSLWFVPSDSMYVYFTPKMWREL